MLIFVITERDSHHFLPNIHTVPSEYKLGNMHHLKNIVVALDLSPMDGELMHYLSNLSKALLPDRITFIHVIPSDTLPDAVFATPEDRKSYLDSHKADITRNLTQLIEEHWGHRSDIKPDLEVREGNPLKTLLQWLKEQPYDLLVVGKKKVSSGSGIVAHKLARRIDQSILFVPQEATTDCREIMIPVDFSDHSLTAMKLGIQLSPLLDNPTLHTVHVYDVPPAVSIKIGRTPEQFSQIIKANVTEAMDAFVEKASPGKAHIKTHLVYNKHTSPSRQLIDFAEETQMHLIIIGAKGHTLLETLFLGSITEKLIVSSMQIPILVVRQTSIN